jgi:hypothetical protein
MSIKCRACDVELEPIRMVDATRPSTLGASGGTHVDLSYAPIDANQSWFTGTVEGTRPVRGMICPKCRWISLYG